MFVCARDTGFADVCVCVLYFCLGDTEVQMHTDASVALLVQGDTAMTRLSALLGTVASCGCASGDEWICGRLVGSLSISS